MSSQILSSTVTLSYPLYACDFDPNDPNRLVVAGGGGAGRSGVGNKISVLDSPDSDHLALSSELELSRDEDNVTTLAVGQTKGNTTQVLAGVNSSPADLAKGKNEHFRVFSLDTPPATPKRTPSSPSTPTTATSFTGSSRVSEVQRSPLFGSASKNVYQRLLRLPPPPTSGPSLIGAAAPSDAPDPEIALFETGPSSPTVRPRGRIELTREAMDLDVIQTADDTYQLAHCDEHELYLFNVAKMTGGKTPNIPFTEGPECVYTVPHDQSSGSPDPDSRPAFRSIRYLTTGFILAVANLPKSKGVVLQGLRLPSSAPLPEPQNEEDEPEQQPEENRKARLSVTRRLPKQITKATSLAVRNLSPPSSPGASAGNTQFVIAVADNSSTISLFTLDHTSLKLGSKPSTGPKAPAQVDLLSNLLPFATLSGIHPMQITGLSFSVSMPPPPPPTGSSKAVAKSTPMVKLASVSVGNTAIVHAIPLREVPDSKSSSEKERSADAPRQQRYIVAVPPKEDRPVGLGIAITLGVLVLAFLGQMLLESQGFTSTNIVGARTWLPQQLIREPLPRLRVGTDHGGFLGKLIRDIEGLGEGDVNKVHEEGGKIVLRTEGAPDAIEEAEPVQDTELKVEVHDEDVHGDSARSWDELKTPERDAWKKKLKESGHWVEDMGEAVFKGILFGEIGGLVGNVMAAGAGLR